MDPVKEQDQYRSLMFFWLSWIKNRGSQHFLPLAWALFHSEAPLMKRVLSLATRRTNHHYAPTFMPQNGVSCYLRSSNFFAYQWASLYREDCPLVWCSWAFGGVNFYHHFSRFQHVGPSKNCKNYRDSKNETVNVKQASNSGSTPFTFLV